MLSAVALAVLTAAPVPSSSPPSVATWAMPGLNCVNVDDKSCVFFGEYLAEHLEEGGGVEITTQAEIGAVLGLERQKQLMGCSEMDNSCLAELAGALGTDSLLLGSVAKVGADFVVSAKVVRSRDAKTLGAASRRVRAESELIDALGALATDLRTKLGLVASTPAVTQRPAPASAPSSAVSSAPGRPVPVAVWAVGGAGVAAGIAGGVLMGLAYGVRSELHSTQSRDPQQLQEVISRGEGYQNFGMPLLIVGGVGIAAAGGLWAVDAASAPRASLSVTPTGWAFAVSGVLP